MLLLTGEWDRVGLAAGELPPPESAWMELPPTTAPRVLVRGKGADLKVWAVSRNQTMRLALGISSSSEVGSRYHKRLFTSRRPLQAVFP
jgi:hypothetical protein